MGGPCDALRKEANKAHTEWRELNHDLELNPDHQKIKALNERIVFLTVGIGQTEDRAEKKRLQAQIDAANSEIKPLLPKVQPLSSSVDRLKGLDDDKAAALAACEEKHKNDKGVGQDR